MADAIISGILNQLSTILFEEVKNEVKLLTAFDDEVVKLRRNLGTIRTVLEDAEEKQVTDRTVKLWLSRLKEVSYDMDDVLDEWRTVLLLSEAKREERGTVLPQNASAKWSASALKRKVRALLSCCSLKRVAIRHDLAVKIKEINARLDEVVKDTVFSGLTPREIRRDSRSRRPETTALVDTSKIRGRDEIMGTLMDSLLGVQVDSGGSDPKTISIVGMGGIGKTALAQKIYHETRVVRSFEKRIWVCVSDFFEESRVAKAIIIALEGLDRNSIYLLDKVPLQALLERICGSIAGKRFFLVLDDVWTVDDSDFESLKRTFKYGAAGSKILVTTRKDGVARMMESFRIFHLEELSQKECWLVLSQAACFESRSKGERESLEGIGRQIAGKCKGFPLAAKTLGSLLRNKKTRQEWLKVLNSQAWEQSSEIEKHIFAPLLLSYYDLPLKIRQCFVYCAAYPKDFVIWPGYLVHLWMAQGYLSLEGNPDPEMEEVGMEYFNYLADRSFFQDFTYYDGNIETCKMHDIVHDFALYLANNEFVSKHVAPEEGGDLALNLSTCTNMRHLTVMVAKGVEFPCSISGTENLRSIITFSADAAITTPALQELAKRSKRLRTLNPSWPDGDHLGREIPSEIGKLVHLRHLNLSCSRKIRELPETICDLINLIFLGLMLCSALEKLPEGIGKLINLRFLRTNACDNLTCYPKGVAKLTALREAWDVIVRADEDHPQEFSLSDLEKLTNLRMLYMKLKGRRLDIGEARKAKFEEKIHLNDLRIKLDENIEEHGVLEALNPPSNSNACITTDHWWGRR